MIVEKDGEFGGSSFGTQLDEWLSSRTASDNPIEHHPVQDAHKLGSASHSKNLPQTKPRNEVVGVETVMKPDLSPDMIVRAVITAMTLTVNTIKA